ncbi:marine proteobacterial sortase target protein [Thiolapillus sp.]
MKRWLLRTLLLAWAGGLGFSLWMMLVIMLWSGVAAAETVSPDSVRQGSLFMRDAPEGRTRRAPLLDTRVNMEITGILARVTVNQEFRNTTDRWQEGIYVFPLPEDAAVDHMRLWIGERFIEGEIRSREQARQEYEQARDQGRQASLLEQERPNLFTTSVANIPPGESIRVEIEYQQNVRYDAGLFSLRFPMVVGPRYIPGVPVEAAERTVGNGMGWALATDQVPDADRITPPVNLDDSRADNPVSMDIRLHAGLPLSFVDSPYHPVSVTETAAGEYRVELEQGTVAANRDFMLQWQFAPGTDTSAAWFSEEHDGAWYGLLMLVPPPVEKLPEPPPREVILVVDVSGSMEGESIVQARQAVELAIRRLSQRDRFNIIRFNHEASSLFPRPVPVTDDSRARALAWVRGLRADGGTEMIRAMDLALDGKNHEDSLRQVVFLTDGDVGNEEALFDVIRQRLGDSRLFTVGIGSAPNGYFMSRAAEHGRGSYTYIGDLGEVGEKMQRLFLQLESPALTDIEVDWGQEVRQWPARVPDLYAGEPVVVAVRSGQPLSGVRVSGNASGSLWSQSLNTVSTEDRPGLHVLWARRQIRHLMGQQYHMAPDDWRRAIEEVALAHHLVSRFTSLVAVDRTPVRPPEAGLDSQALPTALPRGWSAAALFGRLPQTATPANLYLLLGLSGLLSFLLLGRRRA